MFPNLQTIDDDLFTNLPRLTFLVMATHDDLRKVQALCAVQVTKSRHFAYDSHMTQYSCL
jgi:hypothetical protein